MKPPSPLLSSTNNWASLLNQGTLDLIKLKALADHRLTAAQMIISIFDKVQNIVGGKEKTGLLFQGH